VRQGYNDGVEKQSFDRWRAAPRDECPPEGESYVVLERRVAAWIADLPRTGLVAAMTHSDVIEAVLSLYLRPPPGVQFRVDNCSVTKLRVSRGRVLLMSLNSRV